MGNDLLSKDKINLDDLREHFRIHDFSAMPVKDSSEYTEDEQELYNVVLKHINAEWTEISKSLGLNHPQDCYSEDYPPELLRNRVQRIIADNVVKLCNDKKALWNVLEQLVLPLLAKGETGDEQLHNTINALMQTLDIEGLSKSAREFSCDEDFNQSKVLNYPKMDHDKKWNHTRTKIKMESLEEISERSPNSEPPQIPDRTNVEATADIHILIEQLIDSATEQEREIVRLLSEGYNQSEIARKLGVSQSTISRKIKKFKNFLSACE